MSEYALITGGSKGIGLELAKEFASKGFSVIITARGAEALNEAAQGIKDKYGVTVEIIPCDLSQEKGADFLVSEIKKKNITVHSLVNNAGIGLYGSFLELDDAAQNKMLHLNLVTLVRLTRLLLPDLVLKKGGVLNVASTAAFQPGPLMAVYYASKAFVLSFSEALHRELKERGVTVTALCPGPTRSEFQNTGKIDNTRLLRSGLLRLMHPGEVAAAGFRAYMRGKRVEIPGFMNKAGAAVVRYAPRGVVLWFMLKLNEQRG
ncbi:MAG: SDR family NAD(P)-dependent oxidoreductase [Chitinispirillaceae bacterium]